MFERLKNMFRSGEKPSPKQIAQTPPKRVVPQRQVPQRQSHQSQSVGGGSSVVKRDDDYTPTSFYDSASSPVSSFYDGGSSSYDSGSSSCDSGSSSCGCD